MANSFPAGQHATDGLYHRACEHRKKVVEAGLPEERFLLWGSAIRNAIGSTRNPDFSD